MTRSQASSRGFATGRSFRNEPQTGGGGGTPPPDPPPTIVSGPTLTTRTSFSITLSWTANQFVQSWLEYGPTPAYGSETAHETSFNYMTHSQTVSGLSPSTTYHFRVHVVNQLGLETVGSDATFQTLASASGTFPPVGPLVYIATIDTAVPALLTPFTDQLGQTEVVRVFNSGYGSGYAKRCAWNCDMSYLALLRGNRLLDGTTYADLGSRTFPGNPNWSRTDPNVMYGAQTNSPTIRKWTMTPNVMTIEYTFPGYVHVDFGNGEGNLSNDGRYGALRGRKTDGTYWIIRYDFQTKTYIERQYTPSGSYDDGTMSPLGTWVLVSHTPGSVDQSTRGMWLYDTATLTPVHQVTPRSSHFDVGLDINGNEIIVTVADSGGSDQIVMWNMATRVKTILLPSTTGWRYGHISCRNHDRPGWAYISAYGDTGRETAPGHDQLAAIKLDPAANGNTAIERWAMGHHSSYGDNNSEANYVRSPMFVPSPDGQRALFTSEWLKGATAAYYPFVVGVNV